MFVQHIFIIPRQLLIVGVVIPRHLYSAVCTMQIIQHISHLTIGQNTTWTATYDCQQDACYACYFCVKKFQSFRVSMFLFLWKNLIQAFIQVFAVEDDNHYHRYRDERVCYIEYGAEE